MEHDFVAFVKWFSALTELANHATQATISRLTPGRRNL
jgi:hypothetical protein